MIEMVSLAESRLRQGRRVVFQARQIDSATASAAEIAPIIRGACALQARGRRADALHYRLPYRPGRPGLCQRRRACLLQPARRGDARPHHPHQEPAAGRAAAASGQARSVCCRHARCGGEVRRRIRCLCSPARTPPPAVPRPSSTAARASCWCRASGCSAWAARRRTPRSPPTSPRTRSRSSPTRRPSAATSRCPRAICSTLEYWSLEQAKLKGAVVKPLTGQVAFVTGAGAIGAATAKALAADGAAVAIVDIDGEAANKAAAAVKGFGLDCDVTKPEQVRAAFARSASASAASISSCRMPARRGRAGSARSPTSFCARASSSISSRIRPWRRKRCASC